MLVRLLRARSIATIVSIVLAVSIVLGVVADRLAASRRTAHDQAIALSHAGKLDEADAIYWRLLAERPVDVPTLLDFLDNHADMVALSKMASGIGSAMGPSGIEDPGGRALPHVAPRDEKSIDAWFASPDLPREVRVVGTFWRKAGDEDGVTDADRAELRVFADADPPMAWSNHALGLEAMRHRGDSAEAASRFAREATFFQRQRDVDLACAEWIRADDWDAIGEHLKDPRFAAHVSAGVKREYAIHVRDWLGAARWTVPAEYEGAGLGVLALVAVSGLAWFLVCAQIGWITERAKFRVPIYAAAFVLGVLSIFLTLAFIIVEQDIFKFQEKGNLFADAIYFVLGVGLREELAKALLFAPLLPILKRWGRPREVLACGAFVGLGFAVEENVHYFQRGVSGIALTRFVTANFLHMSTTGIVAVALWEWARGHKSQEGGGLSNAFLTVVLAHGFYDFFLTYSNLGSGFPAMLVFVLLTRRFLNIVRGLPGREGPLLLWFAVGIAAVMGASFVYASSIVGPKTAFGLELVGFLGSGIMVYMFVHELKRM